MILEIKNWCEEIVVAVILCIIIESLIPNGNNKKYIKVLIGIYIMYVTLNPILNLLNYEIDFYDLFAKFDNYEESSVSLDDEIKDVYIIGIQENIKENIKNLGYEIREVKVFVDKKYENIEKIELQIKENFNKNENVNLNKIENTKCQEINDYKDIKDYIEENYNIKADRIELKFI